MTTITNPILTGFNPDPSILRVEDDYYIANSTFEWFPGVQIHHSRDLVHWQLLTHPLNRASQLDMLGNPSSGGIWAPDLSYADGLYWLIYTDVKSWHGAFKDTPNYLVTASSITGPWSEPIYLNGSGFDPSLFHDEDGRKWLVNMEWDYRKGTNSFSGILLQEYSVAEQRLVGPVKKIFKGTSLGFVEGPHLYKHAGRYYLMVAEGGTFYEHAVTMARSENIEGPYEVDPTNPVLTSFGHPELALQKAGHASLVETQTGEWYLAHLCGRPQASVIPQDKETLASLTPVVKDNGIRCNLGRETSLQKVVWTEDGWLRLETGENTPRLEVPGPDLPPHPFPVEPVRDDFDSPALGINFNTLRVPPGDDWLTLTARPGFLRLYGRESLSSKHRQSLVARRLQHFEAEITTCLEFAPDNFQQMAGLICIYDIENYFYLRVGYHEEKGRILGILESDNGRYDEPLAEEVALGDAPKVFLRVTFEGPVLQFSYSRDGQDWQEIGGKFDATKLSDEYCRDSSFTGTFVGMCAQDLRGTRCAADFDFFEYVPKRGR
ncbi:MAG: glycoside hydrolase family 43 protein [Chloroflexi bacterium]|nr:glycoside hydrolase family 43 protein [Chloroflexota bacterium]OJW06104.1 MAG: glycoside hydrolase 43 family protein [Chloroflexi bacterium 54-19]